ncbi:MAG TPA: EamA family transporter [Streptosporangiaceae bacterium]|nr:EamA family transporter [Streptosporangiaceae bacterium]
MSAAALMLIFVAALAHASWNLLSKQASAAGGAVFIWLVAVVATVAYAPVVAGAVLLAHPHLTAMNWVFMAGTGALQAGYFLFLQSGYRIGDLSLVYPVGRGTGALLASLAGILVLGERPGPVAIAGIVAIIAGIVLIGLPARPGSLPPSAPPSSATPSPATPSPATPSPATPSPATQSRRRAIAFALATGAFIASYTLWDKYAVTTLRTPAIAQGYAAFPVMVAVLAPYARRSRERVSQVWQPFRLQVIGAAILSPLAYMLVLVALSFTAVSAIAPAREVSVLFGVLLGRRLLGEGGLPRKLAAAAAIVAGIVAVAVG